MQHVCGILVGSFDAAMILHHGFYSKEVFDLQDIGDGISMEFTNKASILLVAVSQFDQLDGG